MARSLKKPWWSLLIPKQITWWKNYPKALEKYQDELEVTDDELKQAQDDSAMFLYCYAQNANTISYKESFMVYLKDVIYSKKKGGEEASPNLTVLAKPTLVKKGIMPRTFKYIKMLRTRKGFTSTIAVALKVVGEDIAPFNGDTFVAQGKGKTTHDGNLIGYVIGTYLDGAGIFRQRGDDPEFHFIKSIFGGFYLDDEPNLEVGPETRQYHVRGIINNEYVGFPSKPFSLTWTSPPPTLDAGDDKTEIKAEEPKA
jgi:hypothetical protein